MSKVPILILLLCLSLQLPAQIQRSNVYLFNLEQVDANTIRFSQPRLLTGFNPNGYNNHPCFIENNLLYLSVQLPNQSQPDLYALNLTDKSKTRITATQEGEYSPSRMPDYYNFSAIRMEFTGSDTLLRLWQFPIRRQAGEQGKPVFKYLDNIGYYHWLNFQQVAVYQVGDVSTLAIANVGTDNLTQVATNVGRTFRTLPNGNLVFIQKNSFSPWQLMEMDVRTGNKQPTPLTQSLQGSEDFVILGDGTILMASGNKIFKFRPYQDTDWQQIGDFSIYNISSISRMAVSQDGKIAIVAR